jgi:hypothetical protein
LFTTTLACTKGTFHHKKGTFSPLKEIGGGGARATRAPPPIPTPLASIIVAPAAPKRKIAHRQVRRTRGPRRITPFTHQSTSARKLPTKISNSCVTGCPN